MSKTALFRVINARGALLYNITVFERRAVEHLNKSRLFSCPAILTF